MKTELLDLTVREQATLATLTRSDVELSIAIPEKADPQELWSTMQLCSKALVHFRAAANKVRPLIGKLLLAMQAQPESYKRTGYRTFDDFMTNGVQKEFAISRGEAYEVMRMVKKFPNLKLEKYAELGTEKMRILTRVTAQGEPSAEKIIKQAEGQTAKELKATFEATGQLSPGELTPGTIIIHTHEGIAKRWAEFNSRAEIQAYCGSADPGTILENLIAECETEWLQETAEVRH